MLADFIERSVLVASLANVLLYYFFKRTVTDEQIVKSAAEEHTKY